MIWKRKKINSESSLGQLSVCAGKAPGEENERPFLVPLLNPEQSRAKQSRKFLVPMIGLEDMFIFTSFIMLVWFPNFL